MALKEISEVSIGKKSSAGARSKHTSSDFPSFISHENHRGGNGAYYKTRLCNSFEQNEQCRRGDKCLYAHGPQELREHRPSYLKDWSNSYRPNGKFCNRFTFFGKCIYGDQCKYDHNTNNKIEDYQNNSSQQNSNKKNNEKKKDRHKNDYVKGENENVCTVDQTNNSGENGFENKNQQIAKSSKRKVKTSNYNLKQNRKDKNNENSGSCHNSMTRKYCIRDFNKSKLSEDKQKSFKIHESNRRMEGSICSSFDTNTYFKGNQNQPFLPITHNTGYQIFSPTVYHAMYPAISEPLSTICDQQNDQNHFSDPSILQRPNQVGLYPQVIPNVYFQYDMEGISTPIHLYPASFNNFLIAGARTREISDQIQRFIYNIDTKMKKIYEHQECLIDTMKKMITELYPNGELKVYGSTSTGLGLPSSDIDCVIVFATNSIPKAEEDSAVQVLKNVKDLLMQKENWAHNMHLVDTAKIPVLKFSVLEDEYISNIDLTCSKSAEHCGLNTKELILYYVDNNPALRELVLVLKSQLVSLGLNEPFSGGMSSYALILLIVSFLQFCGQHHFLISLSDVVEKLDEFSEKDNIDLKYSGTGFCFKQNNGSLWNADIGTLLLMFLSFYLEFDLDNFALSVANGGYFYPLDYLGKNCYFKSPFVHDPLKHNRNVLNTFRLHEILHSWSCLLEGLNRGKSLNEIISLTY